MPQSATPAPFHKYITRTQDGRALFQAHRFQPATLGTDAILKPHKGRLDSSHNAWMDFARVVVMMDIAHREGNWVQLAEARRGMEDAFSKRFQVALGAQQSRHGPVLGKFARLGMGPDDQQAFARSLKEYEAFQARHIFDCIGTADRNTHCAVFRTEGGIVRAYTTYTVLALQLDPGRVDAGELKRATEALHEAGQISARRPTPVGVLPDGPKT